ncbi:hypothetical protein [Opitutus sp. ER46]|nr:hypothetical protein [Opitutus sp. ER46]
MSVVLAARLIFALVRSLCFLVAVVCLLVVAAVVRSEPAELAERPRP